MQSPVVSTELPLLEQFREVNRKFPDTEEINQYKKNGRRIIGWLCTYVPEELIHAAGALPVRISGCDSKVELDDGNAYLYVVSCSFSRSCFQMGFRGKYDCLDGMVAGSTCDGARRLYDHWARYIKTPFCQIISVPHKYSPSTLEAYYGEIIGLQKNLENFLGTRITDDALRDSIAVFNTSRELMRRLDLLRQLEAPPITGEEALQVMAASPRMSKESFNARLAQLLMQLEAAKGHPSGRARVMVIGSVMSNPEFVRAIEDQGCLVVADELCTTTRYWSDPVVAEADEPPLHAIARRYLQGFPCGRMFPAQGRLERLMDIIRRHRVDGVVSANIRYCAPYAHDLPLLRTELTRMGLPVLALDIEYGTPGSGQVATRVQAFLEMIEAQRGKGRDGERS